MFLLNFKNEKNIFRYFQVFSGIINEGIGKTHVNSLLGDLNIPGLSSFDGELQKRGTRYAYNSLTGT